MHEMLEGFMAYLEKNGLAELDLKNTDNWGFVQKTNKLQWYVFLAKRFGLDMHYDYNLYFYGPRSSALTGDHTKYSEGHAENPDGRLTTS